MMKLCCRCGFQPHSKRQDAASTVVFHVNSRSWHSRRNVGSLMTGSNSRCTTKLGQCVANANRQAYGGRAGRIAHPRRQALAQLKNQVSLLHGGLSRVGQHLSAASRFE